MKFVTTFSLVVCCLTIAGAEAYAHDSDQTAAPIYAPPIVQLSPAQWQAHQQETRYQLRLEDAQRRVKRSRAGLIGSSIAMAAGTGLFVGGAARCSFGCDGDGGALAFSGLIAATGGLIGTIVSGVKLGKAKRARRKVKEAGAELSLGPGSAGVDVAF